MEMVDLFLFVYQHDKEYNEPNNKPHDFLCGTFIYLFIIHGEWPNRFIAEPKEEPTNEIENRFLLTFIEIFGM